MQHPRWAVPALPASRRSILAERSQHPRWAVPALSSAARSTTVAAPACPSAGVSAPRVTGPSMQHSTSPVIARRARELAMPRPRPCSYVSPGAASFVHRRSVAVRPRSIHPAGLRGGANGALAVGANGALAVGRSAVPRALSSPGSGQPPSSTPATPDSWQLCSSAATRGSARGKGNKRER